MTKRLAPGDGASDSDMTGDSRDDPPTEDHVYLIGRPPIGEFLGYITANAVGGQEADRGVLLREWRTAHDRVRELEQMEAGLADRPGIRDLPPELGPKADAVAADPIFVRSFNGVPTSVKMVSLDNIVVFQKFINLTHVRRIQAELGEPTTERVFDLCLPVQRRNPPARLQQVAPNVYVVVSPSNDLRFVESIVLRPSNVTGYAPVGPTVAIVGLVLGYSSNYVQAVHVEGRLVLHNGSNRAYALRELGIREVPCLVQEVTRREELEVVGSSELQREPDRYLKTPRPPLLKDYLEPDLRKIVRVPPRNRQVKIGYGVEALDTPA